MALPVFKNPAPTKAAERAGACVLCGSHGDPVVVQENGYAGRSCGCGVVYIDPWPGHEKLAATHDFHVDTYYSYPAQSRFNFLDRMCKSLLPAGSKRILEVGSGPGYTLKLARDAGYEVQSVEPNPHAAAAITAMGIPNEQAMIEDSTLEDGQFDAVFHVDLLSHFANPQTALRSMSRLLKPDGILCFEVGVFGGLSERWYRWIGNVGYPQHPWLYSWNALTQLFDQAGLEVVYRQSFSLFPGTILSTLGTSFFSRVFPKPSSGTGKPAAPKGIYRWYGLLQHNLRYRVGRFLPAFGGPTCCYVAVKPKQSPLRVYSEDASE